MIGAVAQLGERVLCKHDVAGSIPVSSKIKIAIVSYELQFVLNLICNIDICSLTYYPVNEAHYFVEM